MASENIFYAVGLMSGTSLDGIDAALVKITEGAGSEQDRVEVLDFLCNPYPEKVRQELLVLAQGQTGSSRQFALISSLLGQLYAQCVQDLLTKSGFPASQLNFIASHGQTLYHSLETEEYLGYPVSSSLQVGEGSYMAEKFSCPVITDFRVRDIAAGGLGAPLVPFVDQKLYAVPGENLVLLNIGGISNLTFLPARREVGPVIAFDCGPGNMLIDQAMEFFSDGQIHYDKDAAFAYQGTANRELLDLWLQNPYYKAAPPKNSGRENFGPQALQSMWQDAQDAGIGPADFVATLTHLTASVNVKAMEDFCPAMPDRLVISGGGSRNPYLLEVFAGLLPDVDIQTGDCLGFNNEAKEAVAFAYLGYCTFTRKVNTIPSATGAEHPVIMGKISL